MTAKPLLGTLLLLGLLVLTTMPPANAIPPNCRTCVPSGGGPYNTWPPPSPPPKTCNGAMFVVGTSTQAKSVSCTVPCQSGVSGRVLAQKTGDSRSSTYVETTWSGCRVSAFARDTLANDEPASSAVFVYASGTVGVCTVTASAYGYGWGQCAPF